MPAWVSSLCMLICICVISDLSQHQAPWLAQTQFPKMNSVIHSFLFMRLSRQEYWSGFSLVQSLSRAQLFAWTAACQAPLSVTNSRSLFKLLPIKSVMSPNHLNLCHPLLILPSIFPNIKVFSNGSVLHIRWQKYWSFSFSISPSNEYSRLISFWMDCLDLLAVQGTLESLLQHHSSKPSILQCSAFFIVQLSHPYMTTGKTSSFPVD